MWHAADTPNFMKKSQSGVEYACGMQRMREWSQAIEGWANPAQYIAARPGPG